MSSTYFSLHYHIVFSTKNRAPMIAHKWQSRLWKYLGGTVRGLSGTAQAIGGIEDHVHLLVRLKTTHCLADFMRELKKSASQWVHEEIREQSFAWQDGYAAFTVGAPPCPSVRRYIENQAEHHRRRTFREELIELLAKAGVDYDPRYLD